MVGPIYRSDRRPESDFSFGLQAKNKIQTTSQQNCSGPPGRPGTRVQFSKFTSLVMLKVRKFQKLIFLFSFPPKKSIFFKQKSGKKIIEFKEEMRTKKIGSEISRPF